MTHVVDADRESLRERKAAILKRLALSLEELKAKAEDRSLVAEEWDAWNEILAIDFLLEGD